MWNGGDDFASSHGVIDSITFTTGQTPCALVFSSPFGPGSVMMVHSPCQASIGRSYFTPVDLTAGAFPAGWFFGLDMPLPELLTLFNVGAPFTGNFDAVGGATTRDWTPSGPLRSEPLRGRVGMDAWVHDAARSANRGVLHDPVTVQSAGLLDRRL